MKIRISERRNKALITLYKFLQSGTFPQADMTELPYSSKVSTLTLATTLAARLFGDPPFSEENIDASEVEPIASGSASLVDQLQQSISFVLEGSKECANDGNFESSFQKELNMFGITKTRSLMVKNLLNAMASIQPTSSDSERVFSIAGNFCTKLRSSMKFGLLDALIFLKCYFIKKHNLN